MLNRVKDQSGKRLTEEQAAELTHAVKAIRALLDC